MLGNDNKEKREKMKMYLSTLFLSEMENGAEHAITKCNEEFLRRFGTIQDYISASVITDSSGKVIKINSQCDEMMALWDVFRDFKDEIIIDLPIMKAMNTIRAVRDELRGAIEI